MPPLDLRDFEEFCGAHGRRDGKLGAVRSEGDLGCEAALVEHVGVHLQPGVDKLREVGANLGHELHTGGRHEGDFALRMSFRLRLAACRVD